MVLFSLDVSAKTEKFYAGISKRFLLLFFFFVRSPHRVSSRGETSRLSSFCRDLRGEAYGRR